MLLEKEYGQLTIKYDKMDEDYKKSKIDSYKNRKKIKNNINIKQTLISTFNYLRNYKEFNEDFSNNINDITINDKNYKNYSNYIY